MINHPITNLFDDDSSTRILTYLNQMDQPCLNKLTDEILISYTHIIKLNTSSNKKITMLNHLTKLQVLYVVDNSGVNDMVIIKLINITKLNANFNSKITNINHMLKLRILHA